MARRQDPWAERIGAITWPIMAGLTMFGWQRLLRYWIDKRTARELH
jgi:hypothetical protein